MRLRDLNPVRLIDTGKFSYQRLPFSDTAPTANGSSPFSPTQPQWSIGQGRTADRVRRIARLAATRTIVLTIGLLLLFGIVAGGGYRYAKSTKAVHTDEVAGPLYHWQHFMRLNGYYNGVKTLVPHSQWRPGNRYNRTEPPAPQTQGPDGIIPNEPPLDPVVFDPYPRDTGIQTCHLDPEEKVPAPDVYVYPGLPADLEDPFYGSHRLLGLRDDVCFERFGRLGPYGYGYNTSIGGLEVGNNSEASGTDKIWAKAGIVNYTAMDWGGAQKRCYEKNEHRFLPDRATGQRRVKRHAYVLRTWTGYQYYDHQILTLRAMVNELAIKSGGEYDVHLLVHVKNNSIPIWADEGVYNQTLRDNVPHEFWDMATLWSEKQMELYYPEPFPTNFANMAGSSIHGVYRSAHFALQWFSQKHPEYDFYWNWEMDLRFSGHYWEFHNKIGEWAQKQPRKGLWERGSRFWLPQYHGDWRNFTMFVESETAQLARKWGNTKGGPVPVWGPVQDFANRGMLSPPNDTIPPTSYDRDDYEWGVGEDADLLTFNPLFDPTTTNWVFRDDVTGYDTTVAAPPRRAAIITVARLSKRLLDTMHEEVWRMRHTMFPEMWPPSVCLHHGLKAVYVPHPVFFDRDWDLATMDRVLNYPAEVWDSPFGWGEHNLLGSSFYYNSGFSGALWRRWLGQWENGEGGRAAEEAGTGRMCLRSMLHHPVKHERGPDG